jgi:hypothetical protein
MLRKDYDHKCSVEIKINGRESQDICCEEELIDGKPSFSLSPAIKVVSIEATGVGITIGNSKVLLAAVCKIPRHACSVLGH